MAASITERFAWQPRSAYDLGLSAEELGIFCCCSNMAAYTDLEIQTRAGKMTLTPGQLYSTIRQLANRLKVTKDKVARTLKKLAKLGLITVIKSATKSTTHGSLLSVCHLTRFPPDDVETETFSETKARQDCDTNKKQGNWETSSCRRQAPPNDQSTVFDDFPDLTADRPQQTDECAGAGSSDSAPPDPEHQPKSAGADLPKNSAQKGSKKTNDNPRARGESARQRDGGGYPPEFERFWNGYFPDRQDGESKRKVYRRWRDEELARKRQEQSAPPKKSRGAQVPEDWQPAENTVAWARNGTIGATDKQIAEQVEAFRDHHISKGSVFKDFERAFQTWMRNSKRFGQLGEQRARREEVYL